MNDNEIITALECCKKRNCGDCSYNVYGISCSNIIASDTLDLINSQKAENEELKRRNQNLTFDLTSALKSAKAEIERLKGFRKEGFINLLGNCLVYSKNLKDYNDMRKGLKSEARKEFAERLREKGTSPELDKGKYCSDYDIDRTLAEMESERE